MLYTKPYGHHFSTFETTLFGSGSLTRVRYGRLRLIRSVLRALKFSVLTLIEIVILWVYYTPSLLALACFSTFGASVFTFLNYFVLLRITDGGLVPEMRIWSHIVN